MACHYWIKLLAKDDDMSIKQRKEERLEAELNKYWGNETENTWITIQKTKVPLLDKTPLSTQVVDLILRNGFIPAFYLDEILLKTKKET